MAEKDVATKEFMEDNQRFADLFNLHFHGKYAVDPKALTELDTTEKVSEENKYYVQKFRDNLKLCAMKQDDKYGYVILGIENQTAVDTTMPVRIMMYDALNYMKQLKNKDRNGGLKPVITLVMFWSSDLWCSNFSLFDMMDIPNEALKPFIENYRLNVIVPRNIDDGDFLYLKSDIRPVLKFLKIADKKNPQKFYDSIKNDKDFSNVTKEAVRIINLMTNNHFEINEEEDNVNMCEAMDKFREYCNEEGKAEGIKEGIAEGKAQGIAEGESNARKVAIEFMLKSNMAVTEILKMPGATLEEIQEIKHKLDKDVDSKETKYPWDT